MAEWLLYEHDDGRYAAAPSAEAATFAKNDPAWHRVGPVEVPDDSIPLAQARAAGVTGTVPTDTPKPMQGLADWLRSVAETQAADAEQEACMRQWAREVDAADGVEACRARLTREQVSGLAPNAQHWLVENLKDGVTAGQYVIAIRAIVEAVESAHGIGVNPSDGGQG